ncbi:family 16 glycoside hydrolase [Negadavirga shengliensis]|uniref:Family 16 glycoside hydrolase n=1 Tax=Negadavirga shengliensis TaxID=1389218 RepID=A0ABV9T432_9BACT
MKVAVLLLLLGFTFTSHAQDSAGDTRTITTKIADLLNRFPTEDLEALETSMQNMEALGRDGITQMALMYREDANNEKLEYALAGFAFYASHPTREQLARMAVQAYGRALDKLDYIEAKDFIIRQFKWIGKEDATPYVEAFLHDDRLSGTAARTLATIGSSSAEQALILALMISDNDDKKKNFIEALGDFKSQNAVDEITPYLAAENAELRKVAIYALANIAHPSSAKGLHKAAETANYRYEPTNAASLYLRYIRRLGEQGQQKQALKLLKNLDKKTNVAAHYHTKAGVLGLMVEMNPQQAHSLLQRAATSDEFRYRGAALRYLDNGMITANLDSWKKTLDEAGPEIQAAIIRRFGQVKDDRVTETIVPFLKSSNPEVREAAISSVVLAGDNLALQDLLELAEGADEQTLESLKTALQTMSGDNVTTETAKRISSANDKAKKMLIEVLASRAAEDEINVVFEAVNSNNAEVKRAALGALSNMAVPKHLDRLVEILKSEQQEEYLIKIQEAITVANGLKNDQKKQTEWALNLLPQLDQDKQLYIYEVLSSTGGKDALDNLGKIYREGNDRQQTAVVKALNNTKDPGAVEVLLDIARTTKNASHREEALKGYIQLIPMTDSKPEGKVLMLRNALDLSQSKEVKNDAIRQLGNYPTFQALLVAGSYQKQSDYQQAAARAVMNIVLENDDIYGDGVRQIVEETIQVISGQDSQYYKTSLQKYLDEMPEGKGFYPLFDGKTLDGWKGTFSNPLKRAEMNARSLEREQAKADELMRKGWKVEDGLLIFTGEGDNIATKKEYSDFEMVVDWKITEDGDAGIYLRGTPQVQIWDTARTDVGAEVGSGGLYNNETHSSKPLKVADNPVGEWNSFHIKMLGDKVTVHLNGELVVDNVTLENYWDRSQPLFPKGEIELQAHGTYVAYRDIYLRELTADKFELSDEEKEAGFDVLFDGTHMDHWTGNTTDYVIENGVMAIYPDRGGKGNLFTKEEYGDFVFRFEFKLTPGANNGLGIRAPLEGDAAYAGMELQILDDTADIYKDLKEYQFHGSLYGIAAAKKGHLKPVGEWNFQEVTVKGDQIEVVLNGTKILDVNLAEAKEKGTLDGREHPGLFRDKGHIGFLGHGDVVYFKNIRVLDLNE